MEDICVVIGKHKIHLGDDIETIRKYRSYSNSEFCGQDKIEIIQLPIPAYSYILYRGNKYKDVKQLMQDNSIKTNQRIFFCGEGEYLGTVDSQHLDFETCPFDSSNIDECSKICNSIEVYRGKDTIGFDMAQVSYSHCPECIFIALPDKMYKTEET